MDHNLTLTELILLRGFYKEKIQEYDLKNIQPDHLEESLDYFNDLSSKKSCIDSEIENFVYQNVVFPKRFGGQNGNS